MRVLLLLVAILVFGCEKKTAPPKNFEQCILANLKSSASDSAAKLIRDACRKEHPVESLPSAKLDKEQLILIKGSGGLSRSVNNYFVVRLYNGNADIALHEIDIAILTSGEDGQSTKIYRKSALVPPLSSSDLSFDIVLIGDEKYLGWRIEAASGR